MHARLVLIFILLNCKLAGQTIKLDSLKSSMAILTAQKQVDALNSLGWEYYLKWIHSDSALKFAGLAEKKSRSINYPDGEAIALVIQAGVHGRLLGNIDKMEVLSRSAVNILLNEGERKNLSKAYYTLALSQALQGHTESAHKHATSAQRIALEAKVQSDYGWALMASGFIYSKTGNYWKSFEHLIESHKIGQDKVY